MPHLQPLLLEQLFTYQKYFRMTTKKKQHTKKTNANPTKTKATATNGARISFIFGTLFLMFTIILLCSFVSYFTTGAYDQSIVNEMGNRDVEPQNWVGKLGAWLAHKFIFQGFGVASFLFIKILEPLLYGSA